MQIFDILDNISKFKTLRSKKKISRFYVLSFTELVKFKNVTFMFIGIFQPLLLLFNLTSN